jgi:hypothetical protein
VGGNAQRLFFDAPAPAVSMPTLPDWLRDYPTPGPVTLEPTGTVDLPMDVYEPLFRDYARRNRPETPLTFSAYVIDQLRARASALREDSGHKGDDTA